MRDISNVQREESRAQSFRQLLFPKPTQTRKFEAPKTISGRGIPRQKTPFESSHRRRPENEAGLLRFKHANSTLEQRVCSVDQGDVGNPQACAEYAKDISDLMHRTQTEHMARKDYMSRQKDINEKMRSVLIDWLIEVHLKFKLLPETLYLTVNLIDRFLTKEQISRQRLQLVGVTAMLIASKYEEIYPPDIKDFVFVTDQAYQKDDILKMEYSMLQSLDFNITTASPYLFLNRYCKILRSEDTTFFLAQYLMELSMLDMKML